MLLTVLVLDNDEGPFDSGDGRNYCYQVDQTLKKGQGREGGGGGFGCSCQKTEGRQVDISEQRQASLIAFLPPLLQLPVCLTPCSPLAAQHDHSTAPYMHV